ncbi:PREDICTED: uncharacterized protein LOC107358622 isoform X4 [Acropora digitifera]|uniref:uncharacterized protein LOC107358622 isoform X4 n=1 Tax=Acropora digitifera TaxID=70779 RepID=UPI00077A2E2D|nr:PREDICTED: uncharacterized protein LOC107358622 isoform X4 [Acropora digitifera]
MTGVTCYGENPVKALFKLVNIMTTLWYFTFGSASVYSRDIYTSINWDPRNPIFKADGKNCGPGPRQLKVRLNSQIYLVCPNLPTVLQQRGHDVQTSNMKENIWLLHNKTAFDECDVSQVQVTQKTDFFVCNDPTRLVFLSLLFLEHAAGMNDRTFVGGRTFYLIATSHGTQSSVNDLSGGHCNDTSKNVHMKIEVYVCNKTGDRICNSRNVGILTCPPPVTTAPYTSPSTSTLTRGTELGINITESVVADKNETKSKIPRTETKPTGTIITGKNTTETVITDKSETVRKLPTTVAELRTAIIAGEKVTKTTRSGSTKTAANRGKRIGENDEVAEMCKTRYLWMIIAICVSCIAGVLLTLIVIVICCYCFGNALCLNSLRLNATPKLGLGKDRNLSNKMTREKVYETEVVAQPTSL